MSPKAACVIGWPVEHSRSPLIHGYWLRTYALDGSYVKQPVRPDDVVAFLSGLEGHGFIGCNVTLPYKQTAYAVAAQKMPAARAVAAANTLWLDGGKLVADNTDGIGFMNHLWASAPSFEPTRCAAAVLGAGGAARAIVQAFLEAGVAEVRVFNRTRERADAVAASFGPHVKAFDWDRRVERSVDVGILVNATSLGMTGTAPLDMELAVLPDDCIVADIVYAPLVTPLLAAARRRGLAVVDGLGMLLHQAVPGFERWFGVRPQVTDELRDLVVADLQASA
jgi:shikimate dehydrogenase